MVSWSSLNCYSQISSSSNFTLCHGGGQIRIRRALPWVTSPVTIPLHTISPLLSNHCFKTVTVFYRTAMFFCLSTRVIFTYMNGNIDLLARLPFTVISTQTCCYKPILTKGHKFTRSVKAIGSLISIILFDHGVKRPISLGNQFMETLVQHRVWKLSSQGREDVRKKRMYPNTSFKTAMTGTEEGCSQTHF